MDDLQLNISIPKKKKDKAVSIQKNASEYKFISKPKFSGKTLARKRPYSSSEKNFTLYKKDTEPPIKVSKQAASPTTKHEDFSSNLRDLSENKGKYHGKNYQDLSDDIQVRQQKPRSGGWISSLFKNNPDVPRVGQRAVKPIVEKVFALETFADLDIHPHSVANIQQNLGLKTLMTVQQNAVPVILQGRDVLIRSQTGSGKTLAYALPVVESLQAIRPKINRHDGIRVVVVVPTRELAVQTYELFVKLVKPFTWIVPGILSGGQKRKAEKAILRKGLSILVGTPGRINDHLRHTQSLKFNKTNCLILDEADRLLDMGYEKDVAAIVKAIEDHKKAATYDPLALMKQSVHKTFDNKDDTEELEKTQDKTEIKHHLTEVMLSKERQTILLSATLTKAVESLAGITLVDPVFVDTSEGRALVADSLKSQNEEKSKIKKEKHTKKEEAKMNVEKIEEANSSKVVEKQVETKRGLKAFSGLKHRDLFVDSDTTTKDDKSKINISNSMDESDSDSDYEYFKVQKELEEKKQMITETIAAEVDIKPSAAGTTNTFAQAVKTAIVEDELVMPSSVNQIFLVVPMKLRLVTLCSSIVEHCVLNKKGGKMIVFMATLEMVDYHADLIESVLTGRDVKKNQDKNESKVKKKKTKDGSDEEDSSSDSEMEVDYEAPAEGGIAPVAIEIFKLHGSMPHEQRMEVFKQFRLAKSGVLICTDVAARGIDVSRVDLVLQYCAPASATDYVHRYRCCNEHITLSVRVELVLLPGEQQLGQLADEREGRGAALKNIVCRVGRTGRATQIGAAVMFLLPSEVDFVRHLEEKRIRLRQQDESRALEALRTVAPAAASAARAAIAVQSRLEHVAHSHRDWLARASRAYTSWVRFYSGYPRDVRPFLDAKQLHLGHAAKAFALRDTPAALARRAKNELGLSKDRPTNRLTVHEDEEKKRPGFAKIKPSALKGRIVNKQSSMHTASEFDSGLPPIDHAAKKKKHR